MVIAVQRMVGLKVNQIIIVSAKVGFSCRYVVYFLTYYSIKALLVLALAKAPNLLHAAQSRHDLKIHFRVRGHKAGW